MYKILKRILCVSLIAMITFQDVGYSVWAKETQFTKNVDDKKNNRKNYSKDKRNSIMKEAMKKIKEGNEITDEEAEIIDWAYEELEITLPEEEIVWDIDHEKGIGVNDGIMTLSTVVDSSLIKGKKTTMDTVGKIPSIKYSDGEGNKYLFSSKVITSFNIPGIKQTTVGKSICDSMAPQGICCYNGYIFLTAYCTEEKHNAVIYVLDVITKKYITTLLTGEDIHAGGIAYANGYLWIGDTKSSTGYLYYYNFSQIKEAISKAIADTSITAVDISKYDRGYVKLFYGNKASYVTTFNGYLCVGEYMEKQANVGELALYNPSVLLNGIVNRMKIATVPENANGALFYTTYNTTYLIINSNYGTTMPSKTFVYSVSGSTLSPTLVHKKTIELPCMIEEVFNYGGVTYFVFESAAKKYYDDKNESNVGQVCGLSSTFIFK